MKKPRHLIVVFVAVLFISALSAIVYTQKIAQVSTVLRINKEYEKRTLVKKSQIPNAGNGLYAAVKIKKDEVIGELGGRLIAEDDPAHGNHYIASLAECAWEKAHPYRYLDSKEHGGHVSRINFAPSEINGKKTHLQNAVIKQLCEHPYFVFVALRDIEPGEEIWSSYGPDYEYDNFMHNPEVRDFFCGLVKISCRKEYTFSH